MISKLKNQWVELQEEEPKAKCGHGLSAALGILMVGLILFTMWVTR